MPGLLEPGVARKLLLTAAVRQHTQAIEHMLRLDYIGQHVDAATIEEMLQHVLACTGYVDMYCVLLLCKLPVAALLSGQAVTMILQAAMRCVPRAACQYVGSEWASWALEPVVALCALPAAQQLSCEAVTLLLQTAVCCTAEICVEELCKLPAAQKLSSDAVAELLRVAVRNSSSVGAQQLCKLPAA
jgi:hypothetical protein